MMNNFSYFLNGIKNTIPNGEITLMGFLEMIKEDVPLLQSIRDEPDKNKRDLLKSKLSYVTFAGTFEKRAISQFKQGSGLACLDYDNFENLNELEKTKEKIIKDKYTHCVFISPSGKGLKVLIKIPIVNSNEEYKIYYNSLLKYFNIKEGDEGTKDISRACYLSYDSNPYLNEDSEIYTDKGEEISLHYKEKDNSRSGLEWRTILNLLKKGKSRVEIYEEMKAYSKWETSPEQYKTLTYEKAETKYLEREHFKEENSDYKSLTRRGQIENFWKEQPFFYDKYNLFWLWDKEESKWIKSDEIEYLNKIQEIQGAETIDSKSKSELITGFKQIGRKHTPEKIKKSWVQFKDKIYDLQTGDSFNSTPQYFATNPIPWKVGESEDTPMIDKLFCDWIGERDKQILYEIASYSISLDKFMQRIFALIGGGSNGKGTYIKLLKKFLGEQNIITSDLKNISENRFETATLYRKLLCVMGEVSYDDLKNTNQIKKIAGEDMLRFEFKGKDSFSDENTATCICLTNSLPTTPDKSTGFYRKWCIVDFVNQFKVLNKDLIEEIPEIEFENLANKCLKILKGLYQSKQFTNEGDFEERAKRYEERSNPVMRFVESYCDEIAGENIGLREFSNSCNEYLRSKHLRVMSANQIGKVLRDEGFSVGKRKIEDISSVVILNLILNKNYYNYQNYPNSKLILHKEVNKNIGSFSSSGSSNTSLTGSNNEKWVNSMKELGWSDEELQEATDENL